MKFRAKIFLITLLPASILVSASVVAFIQKINLGAEETARASFERLRGIFEKVVYAEKLGGLRRISAVFDNSKFRAAITDAIEGGEAGKLKQELDYLIDLVDIVPDFYELHARSGALLLRHSPGHACTAACRHPLPSWVGRNVEEVFTEFDGTPFLAVWKEYETAHFILGLNMKASLDTISNEFDLRMVLLRDGRIVYSSLPGWSPAAGFAGTVFVDGVRYLSDRKRPKNAELDLVLLREMSDVDRDRRAAVAIGAGGLILAVIVAGLVSSFFARGLSRPVEALVEATHRVAGGDYGATVAVAGRDELARLGRAFNEMTEGLRKRRDIMEKTLSRDVAEELMKGTELGGGRREVTILFMDVRGFTSGTQGVDPAEVVAMINDMMDRLAGAISRHGGNVNKFLGDGLMAMFGAPRPLEDHALGAVRAALEMQKEIAAWNAGRTGRGEPNFNIGIGINTGIVVGGRVGSRERLEYTLIGEEVNLTSRICGKAAPKQVLVTKATYERVRGRVQANALEPVVVKGLSYPVAVFEVIGC